VRSGGQMTENGSHAPASEREIALDNEILRGVVGSTSHGTAIEGQDDRDEMGVFVEPPQCVCGLNPCDHYIYRDQPEGVRSQPGDLDLTMYSLRKYCRLAAQGNPSVLLLLWLPEHISKTQVGAELVSMRDAFVSKEAGKRFLGYLVAQHAKLKGERARTVNRPELVAKYGYDTKFAMHALRLGFEGIELMTDRRLTLPVAEPNLTTLRAVRSGRVDLAEALRLIETAEERLRALVEGCTWVADTEAINRFMIEAHVKHWRSRRLLSDGWNETRAVFGLAEAPQ
jgi:predicted nucleotidyltransferase